MSTLVEAAGGYLDLGMRVIALTGKAPNGQVHLHGLKDAFEKTEGVSSAAINAAFTHPGTTGVGILTGWPYYVVDIDGEEGAAAWLKLVGETDFIPDRWVARTGRGLHIWVGSIHKFPTAKLADKLDFKGDGGYVAAPPSRHPDGHLYEWLLAPSPDFPPLYMPDVLEDLLLRREQEREAKLVSKQTTRMALRKGDPNNPFSPSTDFSGVYKRVREESEGNRNAVLYWAARTLFEEGAEDEDMEELLIAATDAGLGRREARRTIRSAWEASGGA